MQIICVQFIIFAKGDKYYLLSYCFVVVCTNYSIYSPLILALPVYLIYAVLSYLFSIGTGTLGTTTPGRQQDRVHDQWHVQEASRAESAVFGAK